MLEFASQAVEYVRRSLGVTLEYNSETLPVLDHYLRQVLASAAPGGRSNPDGRQPATVELVAATSGAYFGEVVRRRLGGSWHIPSSDPGSWRLVLPSGLWFFPAAMAMAAIRGPDGELSDLELDGLGRPADLDLDADPDDVDLDSEESDPRGWDATLQAPPFLRPHVARVLHGMADVSEDEYYSLCCRLDTLEHVQAVLAAMASARRDRSEPGPD